MPEGTSTVKVVWGWAYLLKNDFNAQVMMNIDGGVYRHGSIDQRGTPPIQSCKHEAYGVKAANVKRRAGSQPPPE